MPDYCIVVLTDSLYLPGSLRTIESWRDHNPPLPVIALSRDQSALNNSRLKALSQELVLIDSSSYLEISPYKKSRSKRHAETFYKFEAFRDFGYDRNIFLDSDLLCLSQAPALLELNDHALLAALDTGFKKTRGYKGHPNEINSGVLSIHKSIQGEQTIQQLKRIARDNPGRSGYNSGDQGIINKWIHAQGIDLGLLSSDYNLIKKDYADMSEVLDCHLLHYCDRKPWFDTQGKRSELEKLWFSK